MIDDTLDFQSSEDTLKDQLLDLENGILNSVSFDFLSHYPKEFEDYKNGHSLLEETFQRILKNGNLTYGIQHSVKAIRALADKELEEAYSILDKIYDLLAENYFLSNDFRDKDENLKPLRGILSLIALRSH